VALASTRRAGAFLPDLKAKRPPLAGTINAAKYKVSLSGEMDITISHLISRPKADLTDRPAP
jgi:hypothetical protein